MNEPDRPDPDALLERAREVEASARRGKLKIFFGACAGVGKTYAMLSAARAAQAAGTHVVVGVVETHGRAETRALTEGLTLLPPRAQVHKGRTLDEFDLDAALLLHPQRTLLLLDELAHSNVPGSRHPKRWQDAQELLAAGVDVWTTMNVQHLESLNDIVAGITGVRVRETVPDHVFDAADEVMVVDLPPDELIARLKAGKVYLPQQAERAAAHFFRKGNLLALRELALRRTADRVDGQMRSYRREASGPQPLWPNREALLACVSASVHGEKVVRSASRLATQLELPWHAVHVEAPSESQADRVRAESSLKLAHELGAQTVSLPGSEVAPELERYARAHNLTRLIVGRPRRQQPWRRSVAQQLLALANDLDVLQIGGQQQEVDKPARRATRTESPFDWKAYGAAAAMCAATALLATPLLGVLELSNILMLFLLVVVGVAVRYGRGPAVMAAFLGVVLFDLYFVAPRFTLAVSDAQYLVTFAVMLAVALVVGQLTAGLKLQARAARQREQRVRSLYDMARDLSAALLTDQVADIAARFVRAELGARSALLAANELDVLQVAPGASATVDSVVTQWCFSHCEPAGPGTNTLPSGAALVLPLRAPMRCRGVLVVEPPKDRMPGMEQRRLLETCASLIAISLERIHYIGVAQSSTVQMESERLRNSLLSAISHDLRTPLASLVGLADALGQLAPPMSPEQQDVAVAIRHSGERMSALVTNLLDMARLQSGAVPLNKAWQPLEEVVGSSIALCSPQLAGRPLEVLLPDGLPLLNLDAALFERVLVNLLENAVKYTPAGSRLELSAWRSGDTVQLALRDHGPGLPPGRETAVFEKFERGSRESATAGVGLGLAICQAIVKAHGGSISGENAMENGHIAGARFTITLPCGTPPTDDGSEAGRIGDKP